MAIKILCVKSKDLNYIYKIIAFVLSYNPCKELRAVQATADETDHQMLDSACFLSTNMVYVCPDFCIMFYL